VNIRSSEGKTRVEWMVTPLDPFARLKKLRVLMRTSYQNPSFRPPIPRQGEWMPLNGSSYAPITIVDGKWADKPAEGQEIDLASQAGAATPGAVGSGPATTGPVREGQVELPGEGLPLSFRIVEMADDGNYRPLGPVRLWQLPKEVNRTGIDGASEPQWGSPSSRPLRLATHPRGGLVISTKWPEGASPPKVEFAFASEPTFGSQTRAGSVQEGTGLATTSLNISLSTHFGGGFSRPRPAPMTATPDGRSLFIADPKSVLHRIDVETWTDSAQLALGSPCGELTLSQAGLVLAMTEKKLVLIVDPQTLKLSRVVPADGLVTAIGAPGSPNIVIVRETAMEVFDAAAGRTLSVTRPYIASTTGVGMHGAESFSAAMTADGRYFFGAGRRVARFRIDEGELVFEEASSECGVENGGRVSISNDGSRVAPALKTTPYVGVNDSDIEILNGLRLTNPPQIIKSQAKPNAVAVSKEAKLVWCGSDGKVTVFDLETGTLRAEFPNWAVGRSHRILPIPPGDRAVYWGETLHIVDTKPERMKNVAK